MGQTQEWSTKGAVFIEKNGLYYMAIVDKTLSTEDINDLYNISTKKRNSYEAYKLSETRLQKSSKGFIGSKTDTLTYCWKAVCLLRIFLIFMIIKNAF